MFRKLLQVDSRKKLVTNAAHKIEQRNGLNWASAHICIIIIQPAPVYRPAQKQNPHYPEMLVVLVCMIQQFI
jgi:hypothetical protein